MATDDRDPSVLPNGWVDLSAAPGSPERMGVAPSFGLDEFAAEHDESVPASSTPAEEPVVAAAIEPPVPAALPPLQPDSSTTVRLSEVIENPEGVDWREAVAIVRQLCLALKARGTSDPVALDPRNILIAAGGRIEILPGTPNGDPLVIQLGRLLRTLLLNKAVPPEVRLVLSQATFELPIFDSVDEIERALERIGTIHNIENPSVALTRTATREMTPVGDGSGERMPTPRAILPALQPSTRRLMTRLNRGGRDEALLVATVVVGMAACTALLSTHWSARREPTIGETRTVNAPAAGGTNAATGSPGSASASNRLPASVAAGTPPLGVTARAPAVERSGPTPNSREATRELVEAAPPIAVAPGPDALRTSPQNAARLALALVTAGRHAEAQIAFDALVLNHPSYQPAPDELPPAAYELFQKSRQIVVSGIAARDIGRARTAMQRGDVEQAQAIATAIQEMLNRAGAAAPVELRVQLGTLLDDILSARVAEEAEVYDSSFSDVVAPRALSRQFPLSPPQGVRLDRVGVLEIVVGTQGDVESVKLHTPLNRYHERMVVSAAKAWRYRPASKDGKPVRYRLSVTINLPESGT